MDGMGNENSIPQKNYAGLYRSQLINDNMFFPSVAEMLPKNTKKRLDKIDYFLYEK